MSKTISIRLGDKAAAMLDKIKKETGCPASETIRRALELYLKGKKQ